MRTYLIRMVVAFGLAAGLLTTVPQLAESAGAWPLNATTQTAEARCLDGLGNIGVNVDNNEVGPTGDMTIVATDRNSGKSYDFGLVPAHRDGEDYTPPPTGIIYLGTNQVDNGIVDFHRHYVDDHAGDDTVSVAYDGVDCRLPAEGSTSSTSVCRSTGKYSVEVTLTNSGWTNFTATSADLPGITPWPLRSGTAEKRTIELPGEVEQSSYTVTVVTDAGKEAVLTGTITPPLNGGCIPCVVPPEAEPGTTVITAPDGTCVVVPPPTPPAQPSTTTTTTATATPTPTLPKTGGEILGVAAAGSGAVGAGAWGCWWGQKRKRKNKS